MKELKYHLSYQIKRTNHMVTLALEKSVRPLGITLVQANVLLSIDRFPLPSSPHLAELAAVTPQAMHRTVTGLERRGLVRRDKKNENEKEFRLSLTPSGADLLSKAEDLIKAAQDVLSSGMTREEMEGLHFLLNKYVSALSGHKDGVRDV